MKFRYNINKSIYVTVLVIIVSLVAVACFTLNVI